MTTTPKVFRSTSIKSWAAEDRPREKLARLGVEHMSDAELIAILLRVGTKERSAVALAKDIMAGFDNRTGALANASIEQLTQAKGIGPSKAITIKAAIELGRRCGLADDDDIVVRSSQDAFQVIRRVLCHQKHEEFWIATANRANRVTAKYRISTGGVSSTVVDTRMILKRCIEGLSSGLILFHNHPSGRLVPSQADRILTSRIQEAANFFDIKVLDHLIVTKASYFSFADEGLL